MLPLGSFLKPHEHSDERTERDKEKEEKEKGRRKEGTIHRHPGLSAGKVISFSRPVE